jgi:Zn-dependent M16 (insulinase) family peptidase
MNARAVAAVAVVGLTSCHPPKSPRPEPAPQRATAEPAPPPPTAPTVEASLDKLTEGAHVRGFTATAVYLDDADHPIGARFVHDATRFTFDYLRIESAPQGFIWVNSFPTSDQGEPHTQEHLLLGKGDRGRRLGSFEAMALAESSAFTAQWRTAYHFHTVAGNDEIWPVFENQLDALLNPDYTDEEIRREVRNFGVDKSDDGKLHLEEKGTVYNEMVRTYESPEANLWREAGQLVYGATHPLALDSGGYPAAIRTMTPADIRKFHDNAYHLANMGIIGAFPSSMSLASVLDQTSAILTKEAGRKGRVMTEADLPKPAPAATGTVKVVEYPYGDTTNPGPMMLVWPASRALDSSERTLLSLFLDSLAGDESTPLYKKLVDSKTRVMDTGANAVWSMVSSDEGQPVYVGLSGVKAEKLDEKTIKDVRALVLAELYRVANLPDDSPELKAFDERVASRVTDLRRRLAKFLDTPPGFGFRGTSSAWMDHLHDLSRTPGFSKSVTMRGDLAKITAAISGRGNPWRDRVKAWGLLEKPFGVAARPSTELRAKLDAERKQRVDAELDRLAKHYGTKDPQQTLAAYQKDYDAATLAEKPTPLPPLVASPPLTLDDGLKYETGEIAGMRSFVATFDSMASARVQLAFDVNAARIAPEDQLWLAALPALVSDAGVIEDGKPIAADEVRERLRREVLELSVYFSSNARTHRLELIAAGAGLGANETKAALGWMKRVLLAPDWRADNLPRLRDLIDQQLTGMRQRMLGAEESWVTDPRDAWWQQRFPKYLHAESFLTQMHDLHRIRWMLADPGDPKARKEAVAFIRGLASSATKPRKDLEKLAKDLEQDKRPLVALAGKDLVATLPDLPDVSLRDDWKYLCNEMARDLDIGAPAALAKLAAVRELIVRASSARIVEVGSTGNQQAIAADVQALVQAMPAPAVHPGADLGIAPALLEARLTARGEKLAHPNLVGLVTPGTSSGVFVNLAPATQYSDTGEDALLDYLASNLYTGHGAHSMFMKTWAAGLAYSNGLHPRVADGTIDYYAERCPLLPQTLRFVIEQLKEAKPDPNIARYAIANSFGSRIANAYEGRASAMAADLADGLTPDTVRAFRSHVLELAKRPHLEDDLFKRMPAVYGKVLPGYGKLDKDGVYFAIGPEKQLAAYQEYLHGPLHRVYPRDFWIPAKL